MSLSVYITLCAGDFPLIASMLPVKGFFSVLLELPDLSERNELLLVGNFNFSPKIEEKQSRNYQNNWKIAWSFWRWNLTNGGSTIDSECNVQSGTLNTTWTVLKFRTRDLQLHDNNHKCPVHKFPLISQPPDNFHRKPMDWCKCKVRLKRPTSEWTKTNSEGFYHSNNIVNVRLVTHGRTTYLRYWRGVWWNRLGWSWVLIGCRIYSGR